MLQAAREISVQDLARTLGCPFEGDGNHCVHDAKALEDAGPKDLGFLRSERFAQQLENSKVGALIAPPGIEVGGRPVIRSSNPGLHFGRAVRLLYERAPQPTGIHATAQVDPSAVIDPTASIGAFCFVGPRCRVGAEAVLHPRVTFYEDVQVGARCVVHAGVVVRESVVIGDAVILQPGVVLGGDGFGYVFDEQGGWEQLPHIGRVVIEDRVEIGANTTIDRAMLGETRIGAGTKIDNLVMIGHNCHVGEHVIMAGHVGVSGSVTVERRAILMGQAGVAGHLTIGEGAFVGARAGVAGDVAPGARVWGTPEQEEKGWLRSSMLFARLPELAKRLRAIERHLGLGSFAKKGPDAS